VRLMNKAPADGNKERADERISLEVAGFLQRRNATRSRRIISRTLSKVRTSRA